MKIKQVIFYFIIFFSSLSIINAQNTDATSTTDATSASVDKEDSDTLPDYRCDYSFLFDIDCKNTNEIKQEGQIKKTDDRLIRNLEVIEITLKKKENELKAQQAILKKKRKRNSRY